MIAYCVDYSVKDKKFYFVHIAARDIKSVKRKLGKKHGYKDGRMIKILNATICGYF